MLLLSATRLLLFVLCQVGAPPGKFAISYQARTDCDELQPIISSSSGRHFLIIGRNKDTRHRYAELWKTDLNICERVKECSNVFSGGFSSDDKYLALAEGPSYGIRTSFAGMASIFDLDTMLFRSKLTVLGGINAVAFVPHTHDCALGLPDGSIRHYKHFDSEDEHSVYRPTMEAETLGMKYSSDGKFVALCYHGELCVVSTSDLSVIQISGQFRDFVFTPDSTSLIYSQASGEECTLTSFNISTRSGKVFFNVRCRSLDDSISFSRDSVTFLYAQHQSGIPLVLFRLLNGSATQVATLPADGPACFLDARTIVSVNEGKVVLWKCRKLD